MRNIWNTFHQLSTKMKTQKNTLMDVSDMGKHVFCPWQLVWVKKPSPASYASNIQHKGNAQITSTVNPVCSEGTHRPLMWSEAVFRACYKKNNLSFSHNCLVFFHVDGQWQSRKKLNTAHTHAPTGKHFRFNRNNTHIIPVVQHKAVAEILTVANL